MTDKRWLRERLLEQRSTLDTVTVVDAGRALAQRARSLVEQHRVRAVAAYLSVGLEPPTWPMLDGLLTDGVDVLVPRALPRRRMTWVRYAGRQALALGRFGIPEPHGPSDDGALDAVDAVVVPALAVDGEGHRLGRGGGYYDTALAAHPAPLRIAVVYDHEVVADVFPQGHDQRVDVAITPRRTIAMPPR